MKSLPKGNKVRHLRRWLPWLGAALLVALIVFGLLPRPLPVETARIAFGPLRSTINEEGRTRLRQRYVVSAPVTGQLRRIPFKAGAEIASTQTIVAVIDPITPALLDSRTRTQAEARRDTASAQLERARAHHKFAVSELRRDDKLFADKTISPQELEQVQLRETAAARDVAAAEAALRQAEAELLDCAGASTTNRAPVELRAPVAGLVLKVFEESERTVAAGSPLLQIGDRADLEVIIETLSRDGAVVRPGTPVELEQWGGAEPLRARVRYVEPAAFTKVSALGVEEQRVYVVADLLTPLAQRGSLGDNFRVEGRIITWQNDRVLKVPVGALFRRDGQWYAYVLANGRAQLRSVKVGHASDSEFELLDGLKEGDQVVLYPGDRVHDGSRVRPVKL